jgi:two-component system cell cycle response regulator DivK
MRAMPKNSLILIVDDFQDNREMYVEYLTGVGYEVAEAEDGEAALTVAFEVLPALIVMDLSLPVIDGWEATRRLRADPRTAGIPIIALTGHMQDAELSSAREAGCDAALVKPCFPEDLLVEIERLLETAVATP